MAGIISVGVKGYEANVECGSKLWPIVYENSHNLLHTFYEPQ